MKIGDKLYKYIWSNGCFEYKVIGIRNYETSTLYELECGECKDHDNCKLLVIKDQSKQIRYKFVEMLNNYDGYDGSVRDQSIWHNGREDGTEYFYPTKKESCKEYGKVIIAKAKKSMEEAEKSFNSKKLEYERIEKWINEFTK